MSVTIAQTGVQINNAPYVSSGSPIDYTACEYIVDFLLTLSGNYGIAGGHGDPLDLTKFVDAVTQATAGISFPFGQSAPIFWEFVELVQAGNVGTGYTYNYCPGPTLAAATQAGGKLQIFGTGAASGQGATELTNGSAYSTFTPSLNNVQVKARFWFRKFQ
jgi:hypothetical protein